MIRVLQIGMSNSLGGIEVFIMNLYRNIDRELFQFDFIDFTDNGICYKEEIEEMGGKIYKVTPRNKNPFKSKKELERIIKENNYKIVHVHLNTLSYITPILIAQKLKNIKIIVHSHNQWNGKNLKTLLLDKLNRLRFNKKGITCLACSDVAGKWIFGNSDFTVIDNGIDIEKFSFSEEKRIKIRDELNISDDCVVLGHVGAFREQKNHKFLIDVFNEYLKINENALLLLVGEGSLKSEIKEKAKLYGINSKIKFLGLRNDTDYIYSALDYFVFPSIFEGLPIAVVEAQTSGLNCVISNKITNEIKLNDNVLFLDLKDDAKCWANAIKKIENNIIKRRKYRIEKYSIKETARNVEKIYLST